MASRKNSWFHSRSLTPTRRCEFSHAPQPAEKQTRWTNMLHPTADPGALLLHLPHQTLRRSERGGAGRKQGSVRGCWSQSLMIHSISNNRRPDLALFSSSCWQIRPKHVVVRFIFSKRQTVFPSLCECVTVVYRYLQKNTWGLYFIP